MPRGLVILSVVVALSSSAWAQVAERRTRLETDDCSRQTEVCERACEGRPRAERLTCRTDCRLAETTCRSGQQR
jgi:hypothetical protein